MPWLFALQTVLWAAVIFWTLFAIVETVERRVPLNAFAIARFNRLLLGAWVLLLALKGLTLSLAAG